MRDITQITNITGITRKGGSVQTGIPYPTDLLARFDTRAAGSLTIQNSITTAHALIKGGVVGVFNGSAKLVSRDIVVTSGQSLSMWINPTPNGAQQNIISGTKAAPLRIFSIALDASNANILSGRVMFADESGYSSFTLTFTTPFNVPLLLTASISGNSLIITRSDTGESKIQAYAKGIYFYANVIGQYYNSTNGFVGKIWGITSPTAIYPLNNAIDTISGLAATNTGVTFSTVRDVNPASTLTALDSGYYLLSTGEKVINPQYTKPLTATAFTGGHVHNFIDSFIDFAATTNPIFDRSNTTVYEQAARNSVYYDSANPYQFHISELLNATVNGYLKAAYKERFYIAIFETYTVKNYIFDIFAYTTQKAGSQVTKIKKYCNDI